MEEKFTLAGCGLFLRVGDVGLPSVGGMYVPSKSFVYTVLNLSLGSAMRLGNTLLEDSCFSLFCRAELTLLRRSFTTCSRNFFCSSGGVCSLAVADIVLDNLGLVADIAIIFHFLSAAKSDR